MDDIIIIHDKELLLKLTIFIVQKILQRALLCLGPPHGPEVPVGGGSQHNLAQALPPQQHSVGQYLAFQHQFLLLIKLELCVCWIALYSLDCLAC